MGVVQVSGEWRRWAPESGEGDTKTPSVLVEAEGVARAGWGELAAVDFSSPLGWLLVPPPRTRPRLPNRNGRAWTCGTGGCLFSP